MYKWVDHKGSTHYTLTPPPANAKKSGTMMTYNDTPSGSQHVPQQNTSNNEENTPLVSIGTSSGSLNIPDLQDGESWSPNNKPEPDASSVN